MSQLCILLVSSTAITRKHTTALHTYLIAKQRNHFGKFHNFHVIYVYIRTHMNDNVVVWNYVGPAPMRNFENLCKCIQIQTASTSSHLGAGKLAKIQLTRKTKTIQVPTDLTKFVVWPWNWFSGKNLVHCSPEIQQRFLLQYRQQFQCTCYYCVGRWWNINGSITY